MTGKPTSEVVAAAKQVRGGTHPIKGMSNYLLKQTAAKLGVQMMTHSQQALYNQVQNSQLPTLARWVRDNKALFKDRPVVVNVTGHYVTVKGNTFIDNNTKNPVRLKSAPFRRSRVRAVFIPALMPTVAQKIATAKAVEKVSVRIAEDSDRTIARRLARQFGFEIELEDGPSEPGMWQNPRFVYAPDVLDTPELDPHDGDHVVGDWKEARQRAEEYARLLATLPCLLEQ